MLHEINLSELKDRVIDLNKYGMAIRMHGHYKGMPLLFKNALKGQVVTGDFATIHSNEGFSVKLLHCEYINFSFNNLGIQGGIQVVGDIDYLRLKGVHVKGGDVGLHMTQHNGDEQYGDVVLVNCSFNNCKHEGVYIGKYEEDDPNRGKVFPKSRSIDIRNCNFIGNLWDGFQGAHSKKITLHGCVMVKNGQAGVEWHNKNLILNPGVTECNVIDCVVPGPIQVTGTTKLHIR